MREEQALEEEAKLFQPTVSQANDILLSASLRANESELERTERLAYVDGKRREAIVAHLQQQHFAQYTYRPQIDSISARLARSKTDDELSANPHGKVVKEELARKAADVAKAECPFRPKLGKKSEQLAASTGSRSALAPDSVDQLGERLAAEQVDRAERLEKARRKVEAEKLRECTFHPQLGSPIDEQASGTSKPLVVKGIARHMELKMMAKRQAEDLAQREQKAFLIDPPARAHPFTVPEPFRLHESGPDERSEKRRADLEKERMQECTFAPQTNEASVAALLRATAGDAKAGYASGSTSTSASGSGYARKYAP